MGVEGEEGTHEQRGWGGGLERVWKERKKESGAGFFQDAFRTALSNTDRQKAENSVSDIVFCGEKRALI